MTMGHSRVPVYCKDPTNIIGLILVTIFSNARFIWVARRFTDDYYFLHLGVHLRFDMPRVMSELLYNLIL